MKLTVLKVLSLFVFLGGILVVGLVLEGGNESGFITSKYQEAVTVLSTGGGEEGEPGSLKAFGVVSGLLMILLGLYGFVPKLPKRRDTFTYTGSAGEVTLPLDTIERSLQKIVGKMSEVKKAKIHLNSEASGNQVEIRVQAILTKSEGMSARATIDRVHTMIHRAAKEHLGLEELGPIAFNVSFALNPKASEQNMRRDVEEAEARGETLLVTPGVAAVVDDQDSETLTEEIEVEEVYVDEEDVEDEPIAEVLWSGEVELGEDEEELTDEAETTEADVEIVEQDEVEEVDDTEEEKVLPDEEEVVDEVETEEANEEEEVSDSTFTVSTEDEASFNEEPESEDLTRSDNEELPETEGLGNLEEVMEGEGEPKEEEPLPEIPEALEESVEEEVTDKDGSEEDETNPLPPYNP